MIKLKGNKVIIELKNQEIKRLIDDGVLFESRPAEFKFLDSSDNIFIEIKKELLK